MVEKLHEVISDVAQSIVLNCSHPNYAYMRVIFPISGGGGEAYLGAGHGTVGILYFLMKAIELIPELRLNNQIREKLGHSLGFICKLMEENNGDLPFVEGDTSVARHFCHGAPGTIPMLLQAVETFPDQEAKLVALAQLAGEATWRHGLVLKGNGLCHGIAGNGYVLHILYRFFANRTDCIDLKVKETNEKNANIWRTRAFAFARALYLPEVQ